MDEQNKNLILATALSFIVILAWFLLFPPPEPEAPLDAATGTVQQTAEGVVPAAPSDTATAPLATDSVDEGQSVAGAPRVNIETPKLTGSISLLGGRICLLYTSPSPRDRG